MEELIKKYRRYILLEAYKLGQDQETTRDLYQEGLIGLYQAKLNFKDDNPTGASFLTYASFYIRRNMLNFLNINKTIRIPVHQVYDSHPSHNPDNPTHVQSISNQTPVGDTGTIVEDLLGYEEEDTTLDDAEEAIRRLLKNYLLELKPEYQTILKMVYYEGFTFEEIGMIQGCSKQNISQKHGRAIKELKILFNT